MSSEIPSEAVASHFARLQRAVAALAQGRMIVVTDDADRENEADLVVAADRVTAEQVAFMVAHTTGILCAPMSGRLIDRLQLHAMVSENTDPHSTAFTITVDHLSAGTGVSATNRARTLRALADPNTHPDDLRRPGHIFPLRAREWGVLHRPGHTEATLDLLRLAGCAEVGVISEIIDCHGEMATGDVINSFAQTHDLPMVSVAELVHYRSSTEKLVEMASSAALPTRYGDFRATAYVSKLDGIEHLALTMGDVAAAGSTEDGVLVRMHSECVTGDVAGSARCDCGSQFEEGMRRIATEGLGVMIYLRGHEGRGIGLAHKLRAYTLQEQGRDTVDANRDLGLPDDSRSYGTGAQILTDIGAQRIRLLTNNPAKCDGLEGYGLTITERIAMPPFATSHNDAYLRTKRDRMGHLIEGLDAGLGPIDAIPKSLRQTTPFGVAL
nr:bifunctional 3,4-dihydroxy-2-butanone-4-phosphate synthase/GTP cyclohydrolase II [Rhodococcus wratislaviensis]